MAGSIVLILLGIYIYQEISARRKKEEFDRKATALIERLNNLENEERYEGIPLVTFSLEDMGIDIIPYLRKCLRNKNPEVRYQIVIVCMGLGANNKNKNEDLLNVADLLIEILKYDPEPRNRYYAAEAFTYGHIWNAKAILALLDACLDPRNRNPKEVIAFGTVAHSAKVSLHSITGISLGDPPRKEDAEEIRRWAKEHANRKRKK